MKHLFLPYELALKLKGKGFNEPCFALFSAMKGENNKFIWATSSLDHVLEFHKKGHKFFDDLEGGKTRIQTFIQNSFAKNTVTAPLYQQVIDWLREKHRIHIAASSFPVSGDKYGYQYGRSSLTGGWSINFEGKTYYDAYNKAIEEAINLLP